MGRVWFTDHPHISATFEDLTIVTPRITNAYFAQKVVTAGTPAQGDTAATAPTVAFNEIHQGILGRDMYILVETENFIPLNQNILSTERASLTVTLKTADCNLTGTAEQTLQITDGTAAIESITVQVGDTTALNDSNGDCPYGNVDEFTDTAIIKVSLRPNTRAVFDTWAENISNAGQDLPAIEIEIAHEDENMIVAYGPEENPQGVWVASGRFMNTDGHRFALQNKNVYEIYHGDNLFNNFDEITVGGEQIRRRIGKIENDWARIANYDANDPRHIVTYFYFDDLDNEHEVCSTEKFSTTAKVRTGVPNTNSRGNLIETIDYTANRAASEDISAFYLEIYENGTLGIGANNDQRWYANQNTNIELIDADIENEEGIGPQVFNALDYNSPITNLRIAFGYQDTRRRYAKPSVFAAVIGALAQLNLNNTTSNVYIVSEGFAYKDGSCYPSSGHVDGKAIDTHYLNNHNTQQGFINALHDYGFNRNIVGCQMNYQNSVNDCGAYGNIHEDHLHTDRLQNNRIQLILP